MYEWQALSLDCSPTKDANCRQLWELAYVFAPRKPLKARLSRIKVLFALDQRDLACELVAALVHEHSYSPHVLNNAGICCLRDGNLQDAREFLVQAVRAATRDQEAFFRTPVENLHAFDTWMSAFRAEHGERAPTAEERGRVVAAVMW